MACDSYCNDCVYCKKFNGSAMRYCSYIFFNDHRRPCPGGEGCTAKVGMKVNRKWRKEKSNG